MTGTSHAYFIGIGGIGMSAIARYLHAEGVAVAGYTGRIRSSSHTKASGMSISAGASEAEALAHFNRWLDKCPTSAPLSFKRLLSPTISRVGSRPQSGCRMGKRSEYSAGSPKTRPPWP